MNRGHETPDHRKGKAALASLFESRGFTCLFEEGLCDVVAWRCTNGKMRMVGCEYERSPRNVIRNATRDFSRGCDSVLVVVSDEKLRTCIRRKLQRELPRELRRRIGISTIDSIEKLLKHYEHTKPGI